MLEALATCGAGQTSHVGQKHSVSRRVGINYVRVDQGVEVCKAMFLFAHS